MEQQTTYSKQKKLARLVFLLGIPNITAVTISAVAAHSLIEWLDFVDTLVAMLGMLIVFLLSRKMSSDLRYEFNYGIGNVEAMTALLCEGLEFCGLLAIAAYMFTVCVRHVRHAVTELLDKTLPEEEQLKILKVMTKHESEYNSFGSVKSHHNGSGVNIDISVSFPPETSFDKIARFQREVQQELSTEISGCHVAVIIEDQ